MLVCWAWKHKMLAHCRPRLKKIFVGESLKRFRRVFRKRKWLEFSE